VESCALPGARRYVDHQEQRLKHMPRPSETGGRIVETGGRIVETGGRIVETGGRINRQAREFLDSLIPPPDPRLVTEIHAVDLAGEGVTRKAHTPHATRVTPYPLTRQVDHWDLGHYPREHVGLHAPSALEYALKALVVPAGLECVHGAAAHSQAG
jgi:hypothetical protein